MWIAKEGGSGGVSSIVADSVVGGAEDARRNPAGFKAETDGAGEAGAIEIIGSAATAGSATRALVECADDKLIRNGRAPGADFAESP